MKNTLIVTGWLVSSIVSLVVCMTTAHFLKQPQRINFLQSLINTSSQKISSPVASNVLGLTTSIETDDARPLLIAQFLEKHASPLTPYDYWGQYLTSLADQYQMDYRLLPSIAMQESNLCKKIPEGTFNCLGLGIHARGTWGFPSFEENFAKAAEILKKNYIDKGLTTPDLIQDKYTPGSNGSWEYAVNLFMDKLENAE